MGVNLSKLHDYTLAQTSSLMAGKGIVGRVFSVYSDDSIFGADVRALGPTVRNADEKTSLQCTNLPCTFLSSRFQTPYYAVVTVYVSNCHPPTYQQITLKYTKLSATASLLPFLPLTFAVYWLSQHQKLPHK